MPEVQEAKSERITLAVTPSELAALEFLHRSHGGKDGKYDGASSVVRDYSLVEAIAFHRRALGTKVGVR